MVIDHDDVEAGAGGGGERRMGGDAAIDGDDDAGALFLQLQQRRFVRPVAFALPIRNIRDAAAAGRGNEPAQQRRGGRAVDIVVAEDRNGLAALDGLDETLNRAVHILEHRGIGQHFAQRRRQELLRVVKRDVARRQHAADDLRHPQPLRERQRGAVAAAARPPPLAGEGA